MKKAFILLALCCVSFVANAQITTGQSTSKVIRTGNRAQAGNFGIYLGATTDMFQKITDKNVDFSALPLINLKYMATDNIEYRVGIEWWKTKNTVKYDGDIASQESEKSYMFYPGVAYHFNNKNLLDVYVGAELPFGFGNKGTATEDDDYYASQLKIGLGAFIGLQAYIANLPVALGCEYGVSTLYNHVGDGTLTQDGMTISGYQEDVSNNVFKLGHQIRFTLTYYFDL